MDDVERTATTWRVVVMGVSGSGKSTVGAALARALGVEFVDGDSLHPRSNVDKMAAGEPLDDDDRWPWLADVRAVLRREQGVVVACSALARRYRDFLRQADGTTFVFLDVPEREAVRRLEHRLDHFMGAAMVASQFLVLERPGDDETDVVAIDAVGDLDQEVERACAALRRATPIAARGRADGRPNRTSTLEPEEDER